MQEIIKLLIGVGALMLGYPLGTFLKNSTKDEQIIGKPWFITITWVALIAGFIGLIIRKDWLMFTGFFITIVTAQSLKK